MISQTQYDKEMNRRKGLAEFCRRVNSSNTQTASAPTLDQTSSNNTVPSASTSTTDPTIDSVIARTPRISNSPSKIVKNLTMKNSKIGEKVLLKIAYAFFHEKSLTQAKTSFQKETLTNFEKHILVGFVLDRDYLSAYQYFRSFFTVDRRSIFTSEDIHDIRTISSILLEAHFCASVTSQNLGDVEKCWEMVTQLLNEFSFGQGDIGFKWKAKLLYLENHNYAPIGPQIVNEITKIIPRLAERIENLSINTPFTVEETQLLVDSICDQEEATEENSNNQT